MLYAVNRPYISPALRRMVEWSLSYTQQLHVDGDNTKLLYPWEKNTRISEHVTADLDALKKKKISGCAGQGTSGLRLSFVQPTGVLISP